MFALKAHRCLYTWFYQQFGFLEVSKLYRTVSGISTYNNKEHSAVNKTKRKRSVIQKNEEKNDNLVAPVDCQKSETQMNILNPSIKEKNYDSHDLSEAEMKIVTEVVYDILSRRILNSNGKNLFLNQIRKTFNIHKSVPLTATPVKPAESVTAKENVNFTETPKPQQFSFPMFNTLKEVSREEAIVKLKSRIPKDFRIGENVVSSTHILESTRPDKLSKSQEIKLSMEDKLVLENHLSLHLMKYIQEKTPPGFPDPDLPNHLLGYWKSLQFLAKKITDVKGFDIKVTHPLLRYTATADIVCSFEHNLVVMDWKTYLGLTNASLLTCDYSLQAIACVGALNFDVNLSLKEPVHAVSVLCYRSGSSAHTLCMNYTSAQQNWKDWLRRLGKFYREQNKLADDEK